MMRIEETGLDAMIARTLRFGAEATVAAEVAGRRYADGVLASATNRVAKVTGNLAASGRVEQAAKTATLVEFDIVFGGVVGIDRYVDYAGLHENVDPFLVPAAIETIAEAVTFLEVAMEEAARVAVKL